MVSVLKKRLLHTSFLLLYTLVLLQLPSYAHFCGDVRVEENCCADENGEKHTDTASIEASCCTDVLLPGVADEEHKTLQDNNEVNEPGFAVRSQSINPYINSIFKGKTLSLLAYYHHFSPPTRVLHKLYKQFVVYH